MTELENISQSKAHLLLLSLFKNVLFVVKLIPFNE